MTIGSDLDRRRLLFGALSDSRTDHRREHHISSLLIHARPEQVDEVRRRIASLADAEIHASDCSGKLVVTLETRSEHEIVQGLNAIQDIPGVLSAALVFHHFEADS